MRLITGLILMLIGAAIMLYGMFLALRELGGLYQAILDDPMGDTTAHDPDAASEEPAELVQQEMIRGVIIGAVGILPFLTGVFIFKGEIARKLIRARRG